MDWPVSADQISVEANQVVVKVEGTKEWVRTNRILDPAMEEYKAGKIKIVSGKSESMSE